MNTEYLPCVEINPPQQHEATVILMHGLGADGHDFVPAVEELGALNQKVRFVFPHAPAQAITINGGYHMPAWYDILGLDASSREDEKGVRASAIEINKLIDREVKAGLPSERVFLAGFSQGGAMALYCGLRYHEPLGGILGLSCYLPLGYTLAAEANAANKETPVFMAHGTEDPVIPLLWAQTSCDALKKMGYAVDFKTYKMQHSVCSSEMQDLAAWLALFIK